MSISQHILAIAEALSPNKPTNPTFIQIKSEKLANSPIATGRNLLKRLLVYYVGLRSGVSNCHMSPYFLGLLQ